MDLKERWRGPGRRGSRAAEAFCFKIKPRKVHVLAGHPAGAQPRACGVWGRRVLVAHRWRHAGRRAKANLEAERSFSEREKEGNPQQCSVLVP